MDVLYAVHLLILLVMISIPLWPPPYLKYGVYLPVILSATWVIFNGCPLTAIQSNIEGDNFTREIYSYIIPNISEKRADHVTTFILILITTLGMRVLKSTPIADIIPQPQIIPSSQTAPLQ